MTQVIHRRRERRQAYIPIPVEEEDLPLSTAMQEKIERGLQHIKEGKGKEYSLEQLREMMGV